MEWSAVDRQQERRISTTRPTHIRRVYAMQIFNHSFSPHVLGLIQPVLRVVLRSILAIRRLDISKSTLSTIKLSARVVCAGLELHTRGDRLVAAESFAHIDQPTFTLSVSFLQLLASGGEGIDERRAKAIGGAVALDHDTVALLEAFGQCGT